MADVVGYSLALLVPVFLCFLINVAGMAFDDARLRRLERRADALAAAHGWQAGPYGPRLRNVGTTYGPYVWGTYRGRDLVCGRLEIGVARSPSRGGQTLTPRSTVVKVRPLVVLGELDAERRRGEIRRGRTRRFDWECDETLFMATLRAKRFPPRDLPGILEDMERLWTEQPAWAARRPALSCAGDLR